MTVSSTLTETLLSAGEDYVKEYGSKALATELKTLGFLPDVAELLTSDDYIKTAAAIVVGAVAVTVLSPGIAAVAGGIASVGALEIAADFIGADLVDTAISTIVKQAVGSSYKYIYENAYDKASELLEEFGLSGTGDADNGSYSISTKPDTNGNKQEYDFSNGSISLSNPDGSGAKELIGRSGSITSQTVNNSDGSSAVTVFDPNDNSSTETDYQGPNGIGKVKGIQITFPQPNSLNDKVNVRLDSSIVSYSYRNPVGFGPFPVGPNVTVKATNAAGLGAVIFTTSSGLFSDSENASGLLRLLDLDPANSQGSINNLPDPNNYIYGNVPGTYSKQFDIDVSYNGISKTVPLQLTGTVFDQVRYETSLVGSSVFHVGEDADLKVKIQDTNIGIGPTDVLELSGTDATGKPMPTLSAGQSAVINLKVDTSVGGSFFSPDFTLIGHDNVLEDEMISGNMLLYSVVNYAVPSLKIDGSIPAGVAFNESGSTYILDFGTLTQGSNVQGIIARLALANNDGYIGPVLTDALSGSSTIRGDQNFQIDDIKNTLGKIQGDNSELLGQFRPDVTNLGENEEQITLHLTGSNGGGYVGALPDINLIVRDNVVAPTGSSVTVISSPPATGGSPSSTLPTSISQIDGTSPSSTSTPISQAPRSTAPTVIPSEPPNVDAQTPTLNINTTLTNLPPINVSQSVGTTTGNPSLSSLQSPSLFIEPSVLFSNGAKATLSGSVASIAGIAGVEIFQGDKDLGAAAISADGTFQFSHVFGRGSHTGLTAVATDIQGNITTVPIGLDLTTGIRNAPYLAEVDSYDSSGAYLGSSQYGKRGVLYLSSTAKTQANGNQVISYSGGSFFDDLTYSSYTDVLSPDGDLQREILNNNDETHAIKGYQDGVKLFGVSNDTMTGGGQNETFVFKPHPGQETVTDFITANQGHDFISLSSRQFSSVIDVLNSITSNDVGNAVINLSPNDAITLQNVTAADLKAHPEDFRFHP